MYHKLMESHLGARDVSNHELVSPHSIPAPEERSPRVLSPPAALPSESDR
jgi:hypothetical protein